MPTKGWDINVKEKRGRSPMLPRKVESAQQVRTRSPPSTLDRKDAGSRKVPIYEKHTVSSILYAQHSIRQPYVVSTKFVPQSKVTSVRSKINEKKVTSSRMNTAGATKTKDLRKPHIAKKQMRQSTDGFGNKTTVVEKNPRLSDALSSSKDGHNVVTHEQDDKTIPIVNSGNLMLENIDMQRMDSKDDCSILTCEGQSENGGEAPLDEPLVTTTFDESVNIEHIDDNHDDAINEQNQPDRISDHGSDDNDQPRLEIDQEDQELKDEQGVQELESKDDEHEEPGCKEHEQKVLEIKEGGEAVPNEEEHMVVAHGKMDTAAYNYVIEATLSELRQQRLNRVKALVGAFENLISLECDALQKSIKQY